MKQYRITWRHELIILAKDDKEAIRVWEETNLKLSGTSTAEINREGKSLYIEDGYVEEKSFDCISDKREVRR